jgi:ABC-2 type transport system ATP-binding protein
VVSDLSYRYGDRVALDELSFSVASGEIFGLLGPNGGGKTTLFTLLTTLRLCQTGRVVLLGNELPREAASARRSMGVVFQSPSLDPNLTVSENLACQGLLYGIRGTGLRDRVASLLRRFDLAERASDRVAELSGGMRRRAEIAKALIHGPRLLILDEPSTGLDPGIRRELWALLEELRGRDGVTVLLTTHFMEEGDRCDRVALLDGGRLVALGVPTELKSEVGGEVVQIGTSRPAQVVEILREKLGIEAEAGTDGVRFERHGAHREVVEVVAALPSLVQSITVSQPTLEDVFLHRTGRRFSRSETG